MQQFNKYKGLKGSRFAYNHQVRTVIEEKSKETVNFRLKVIDHARFFGMRSALDAFDISERTIKYWRSKLRKKNGNPNSLVKKSTRPNHFHQPEYSKEVYRYVVDFKKVHPRIGKEKIAVFLKRNLKEVTSPSTIRRIILLARKNGELPEKVRYSFFAKTGKLIVRKGSKPKKKLRRNGYMPKKHGDLIQVDTIELRIRERKFFLSTGVDLFNRKAYARVSHYHNSKEAKDFLMHLPQYFGYAILHAQTDNGKEFKRYFDLACEDLKIDHFWNHPRTPKENAFVERFNRTIQEEWVTMHMDLFYLKDIPEIQASLETYLEWYNTERPHWGLKLKTPKEFEDENI